MSIHSRLDVCKPFLGLFAILFAPRSSTPPHVSRAEVGLNSSKAAISWGLK